MIVITPLLIPLVTACVAFLARKHLAIQRGISLLGATAFLVSTIVLLLEVRSGEILVHYAGNWPAPFGIVFVGDMLAAIMVLLGGLTGFATILYSFGDADPAHERSYYHPLVHVLLFGVTGAFLTGDLFNLFVWFEVLLMASFVLLSLGNRDIQLEGTMKYVILNLVSSAMFLMAVGLMYGFTGSLNMADLSIRIQALENPGLVTALAMLFMVSFGIKAGVFPLFFWLPSSYHTPLVGVSALFAGLLTKVGVYALIRVFTLLFNQDVAFTHGVLLWVSLITMVVGVLGAMAQDEIRRILSFHIISQIGYMTLGLALYTPLAIIGAVFYIGHHIIVKANLFFVAGLVYRLGGSMRLSKIGGFAKSHPYVAVLFLIPAFSLAGIPPLSGFWAKFVIVKASLEAQEIFVAVVALIVGLFTMFSMTKIWAEAFWKDAPAEQPNPGPIRGWVPMVSAVAFLAAITVLIGLNPQPLWDLADLAASQLLDPSQYQTAVLEGQP